MSFPTLTAQFFPGVELDQLYVQVLLPAGAAIGESASRCPRGGHDDAGGSRHRRGPLVIGESAPAFYYNMQANRDAAPHFAEALVFTRSDEGTERAPCHACRRVLDAALPWRADSGASAGAGSAGRAPLEMRLVGPISKHFAPSARKHSL